ncbi:uncharacterized protein CDAR_443661 [Caerostris darwini]|uniref:Uncharacterized protein n=1 Tax=Caerostris darwini TaxID=1538125 RepID=A0AAV4TSN2_9ARAC|nr:uncharacterized protein CDAR_443661 [Caerostris darwini]
MSIKKERGLTVVTFQISFFHFNTLSQRHRLRFSDNPTMISQIFFLSLVAVCLAQYNYNQNQYAPQNYQHQPQNNQVNNGAAPLHYVSIGPQLQGDYKFGYNTGKDGVFREETRNPDGSVSGAYGYIDASGKQKVIKYTAGKDGFKAEGDDIPKAPPAPQPAAPAAYQPQQPAYQPQQSHYQPQQYQPAPQYQPQPAYNNYVQPQQSQSYNQYSQPQGGAYNPFAYHTPAPGQAGNPVNQLSYSIGGGQSNHYQG